MKVNGKEVKEKRRLAKEPREPMDLKTKLASIAFNYEDRYKKEKPSPIRFDVAWHVKGRELLVNFRLPKQITTRLRAFRPEVAREMQSFRKPLEEQLKNANVAEKPGLEEKLDELDLDLWLADAFKALHKQGKIHFRVFAAIGDMELELGRTDLAK